MFYQISTSGVHFYYENTEPIDVPLNQTNGVLIEYRDPDTQRFSERTISNGLYIAASGTDADGNFVDSGKVIQGVMCVAIAKTTKWDDRGVSAFGGTALQLGSGVATNEFWAVQPEYATEKAKQLVGVFAVVSPCYRDCGINDYTALHCLNTGTKQAQTGISVAGNFNQGIDMSRAYITNAGIRMAQTIKGSRIEYGNNTYTYFDGTAFVFVINGREVRRIQ